MNCSLRTGFFLGVVVAAMVAVSVAPSQAAFPGTNGRITVNGERADLCCPSNPGIWTMNPNGTQRQRISRHGVDPVYSASGHRIAFYDRGLETMLTDGSHVRLLTKNASGYGYGEAWSPSGNRIAFIRNGSLWTIRSNGRSARRLTSRNIDQEDSSPAWAPDGKRIAFTEFTFLANGTRAVIKTVRPNGSGLEPVPTPGNYAEDPDWSPDASRLAYDNRHEIVTQNLDGSDQQTIAVPAQDHELHSPVYSPDGTKIAFNDTSDDPDFPSFTSLYVVPSAGGEAQAVVDDGASWDAPSWQPR